MYWSVVNLILVGLGGLIAITSIICGVIALIKKYFAALIGMLVAPFAAIVGVVVFIVTENMNSTMALVDKWTIVNLFIFLITISGMVLTMILAFKRKKGSVQ